MFDSIIAFSVKHKLIIGLMVLILIVWGGWSLTRLNLDALPDITNNQVQVITTAPNLAPTEVEQFITYPLEIGLAGIPKVQEIRSISRFGLSVITVVFEDDVNVYLARQQVSERLASVQDQVPAKPTLGPITTGLGEIYQYTLQQKEGSAKTYNAMDLRTIQDWMIKRQLLGTEGVADVSSFGGFVKQYEVAVKPERLKQYNVSFHDLMTALQSNNENTGGAYIEKDHSLYYIRGIGLLNTLEEVASVPLPNRTDRGVPLTVGQVAEVRYGSAVRYGALTRNGQGESVGGIVLMLKGENSLNTVSRVKEKIASIQKSLPEGVEIVPYLDRTVLLNKALNTVQKNLLEGGLIVVFILVLLLGNFRAGLVVASVIPLALLFAIGMMRLTGVSGNLMSLGAIDFGLVVDGAVIIVESIVHRIHLSGLFFGKNKPSKDDFDDLVIAQAQKIRKSASFGEIIILIVYLPILALSGIEGKMFRPMAETVSYAIIGALILSLTYVPMMSALTLNHSISHKKSLADRLMDFLRKLYIPVLIQVFRKSVITVVVAIAVLAGSIFLFSRLGGEFIPQLDEGDFAVEVAFQPGTGLNEVVATSSRIEKELLQKFPEIKQIVGKIGTAEIPTDPMPIERMDMMIVLKDRSEWSKTYTPEQLADEMQKVFDAYPGVGSSFQQPIQMRFNELMTGAKTDIAIQIFGEDLDTLAQLGEQVLKLTQNVDGTADGYVENVTGLPQLNVTFLPERLAQYGLTKKEVNEILSAAYAGVNAGTIYEGEKKFDLVIRLAPENRIEPSEIGQLFVPLPAGGQVPFSDIAKIELVEGPGQISRERTRRRITIGLNVRDRDVESVIGEIESILSAKLSLPEGYSIHYGGEFENLIHAKARLAVAVPVALVLILGLLYFSLGSIKEAFMIFTAIPFSAVGGVMALYLRDMPFSISAGVGFIALFGVAVLNGLVLIGYFHELKAIGYHTPLRRTITGSAERLRPVMMTALVASLGFLPMALSTAPGAEVQRPLATVVIGGLITATLLTLFLLPLLYYRFQKR